MGFFKIHAQSPKCSYNKGVTIVKPLWRTFLLVNIIIKNVLPSQTDASLSDGLIYDVLNCGINKHSLYLILSISTQLVWNWCVVNIKLSVRWYSIGYQQCLSIFIAQKIFLDCFCSSSSIIALILSFSSGMLIQVSLHSSDKFSVWKYPTTLL